MKDRKALIESLKSRIKKFTDFMENLSAHSDEAKSLKSVNDCLYEQLERVIYQAQHTAISTAENNDTWYKDLAEVNTQLHNTKVVVAIHEAEVATYEAENAALLKPHVNLPGEEYPLTEEELSEIDNKLALILSYASKGTHRRCCNQHRIHTTKDFADIKKSGHFYMVASSVPPNFETLKSLPNQ